jgi:disulfide bond formation protein DsbB
MFVKIVVSVNNTNSQTNAQTVKNKYIAHVLVSIGNINFIFYLKVSYLGLNYIAHQPWHATPVLCGTCRSFLKLNLQNIAQMHEEELLSITSACSSKHCIVINTGILDLFTLTYRWLDIESLVSINNNNSHVFINFVITVTQTTWSVQFAKLLVNFTRNLVSPN